ncbi:MAG: hypothetical protein LBR96_06750, partial [Treponema sp.]|nr:hypothetical protein [Treponema sp.]
MIFFIVSSKKVFFGHLVNIQKTPIHDSIIGFDGKVSGIFPINIQTKACLVQFLGLILKGHDNFHCRGT